MCHTLLNDCTRIFCLTNQKKATWINSLSKHRYLITSLSVQKTGRMAELPGHCVVQTAGQITGCCWAEPKLLGRSHIAGKITDWWTYHILLDRSHTAGQIPDWWESHRLLLGISQTAGHITDCWWAYHRHSDRSQAAAGQITDWCWTDHRLLLDRWQTTRHITDSWAYHRLLLDRSQTAWRITDLLISKLNNRIQAGRRPQRAHDHRRLNILKLFNVCTVEAFSDKVTI